MMSDLNEDTNVNARNIEDGTITRDEVDLVPTQCRLDTRMYHFRYKNKANYLHRTHRMNSFLP